MTNQPPTEICHSNSQYHNQCPLLELVDMSCILKGTHKLSVSVCCVYVNYVCNVLQSFMKLKLE